MSARENAVPDQVLCYVRRKGEAGNSPMIGRCADPQFFSPADFSPVDMVLDSNDAVCNTTGVLPEKSPGIAQP
jgi:hypothetical protein